MNRPTQALQAVDQSPHPEGLTPPAGWDRRGLPGWTYHSPAWFDLERRGLFLTHWMLAGHVADVASAGDWLTYDILGERALILRGRDGELRAFHNLCRHRGARVVDGTKGSCKGAIVCPFHGWVYNLDGTLRGPARPDSYDGMDRSAFGLKPIEMQIWHGFIFLRFHPGPQPDVADWLSAYDADFVAYGAAGLEEATEGEDRLAPWSSELPVNWKSVRDVDNEGYHVAMAHPGLQELYGDDYQDLSLEGGLNISVGRFGGTPPRTWSVRNYERLSPQRPHLPHRLQRAWTYYGIFPNAVIAFTPEGAQIYGETPLTVRSTRITGRNYRFADESRQARAARYLAMRIDRETSKEDQQLSIWSDESMASSAFDDFHLSDLEYGVRRHHDELRAILPFLDRPTAPAAAELDQWAEKALLTRPELRSNQPEP